MALITLHNRLFILDIPSSNYYISLGEAKFHQITDISHAVKGL